MDIIKAAVNTETIMAAEHPQLKVHMSRSDEGKGICHAYWMLNEIEEARVTDEKAHRWLGYAQALLVAEGYLTLQQCKLANLLA